MNQKVMEYQRPMLRNDAKLFVVGTCLYFVGILCENIIEVYSFTY